MTASRTTYRRADGQQLYRQTGAGERTPDHEMVWTFNKEGFSHGPALDVIEEQWELTDEELTFYVFGLGRRVRFRTIRLGTNEVCDVCEGYKTMDYFSGFAINQKCSACEGSGVKPRVVPPWTEAEVWRNIKTGQPLGFTPPPNHTSPKLPEKLNTEIDYGDDNLSRKPPWYLYRPPLNGFERARAHEIRKSAREKKATKPKAMAPATRTGSCERCEQWKAVATQLNEQFRGILGGATWDALAFDRKIGIKKVFEAYESAVQENDYE